MHCVCARLVRAAVDEEGRNSLPLTSSPGHPEEWETEKDRYLSSDLARSSEALSDTVFDTRTQA